MIRNLLVTAASSIYENQRNQSIQRLNLEYRRGQIEFLKEIFQLICSHDRTDHILAYSFLKKIITDSQKERLIDMNPLFERAYVFLHQKNAHRTTIQQMCAFEKQNLIHVNALYLSLNSSGRYRQDLVDTIPFKICELFTKSTSQHLFLYLAYYAEVLTQLEKYRIGNINSKKSAMGSVMLTKITKKLSPQNSLEASLWLDFIINYSKFNNWTPDPNFYINSLTRYKISKSSLISLLDYLSTNFKIIWSLEDHCRILHGLNDKMTICEAQINDYSCKEVESILKCLKNFLHNFFVSDKQVSHSGEAIIVEYIYSYDQFEKISRFIINMIEHFSINNQKESMGNLSQLIVQYSTQILRLYSGYLKQGEIEVYSRRVMQSFGNQPQYEKLFVFFSSLPKFILEMFNYQQGVLNILNGKIELSEKYEPVYINFLTHYITLNDYIDEEMLEGLAKFIFSLISARQTQLSNCQNNQREQDQNKSIERISLSIHGMSKLSKFKKFVDNNVDYFETLKGKIFQYLFRSTNQFSILVEAIDELIRQKRPQWNHKMCVEALSYLTKIYDNNLKSSSLIYYQIEAQLYRIMRRTLNLEVTLGQIQHLIMFQNYHCKFQIQEWTELKILAFALNLEQKSDFLKEQILFCFQELIIQFNILTLEEKFKPLQSLLSNFFYFIVNNFLFQFMQRTLSEHSESFSRQMIHSNQFQKVQIANEEYAIIDQTSSSKELHLSIVKILLQFSLHQQYLETIYNLISKSRSRYISCIWEAVQILYPGKIDSTLIPQEVMDRLQKMRNGKIVDLLQNMDLNQEYKMKKQTPSWFQLYRNILRQDSVVNEIIDSKINQI